MYLKFYPSDISFKDNLVALRDNRRKSGSSEFDYDIRCHKNQNRSACHVFIRDNALMADGFAIPLSDIAEVTYYLN